MVITGQTIANNGFNGIIMLVSKPDAGSMLIAYIPGCKSVAAAPNAAPPSMPPSMRRRKRRKNTGEMRMTRDLTTSPSHPQMGR